MCSRYLEAIEQKQTPVNVKVKPQPTKQQPQNPEALQEYLLSQSLIYGHIVGQGKRN